MVFWARLPVALISHVLSFNEWILGASVPWSVSTCGFHVCRTWLAAAAKARVCVRVEGKHVIARNSPGRFEIVSLDEVKLFTRVFPCTRVVYIVPFYIEPVNMQQTYELIKAMACRLPQLEGFVTEFIYSLHRRNFTRRHWSSALAAWPNVTLNGQLVE